MQELTDDDIKDLIRMGHKSREFERDREFWLGRGWSEDEIGSAIRLAKEFESGKLKLEMGIDDKKRIIKKNIVLFQRMGFSDEETEEMVRDAMKDFIPITSKSI